jgi:hypothetical protein
MKFHAFVAGAAFAALTSIAHAAVIERTFDVEASGFTLASGPSVPAAVDPVTLNFTLIWDPSTITAPTASGLRSIPSAFPLRRSSPVTPAGTLG